MKLRISILLYAILIVACVPAQQPIDTIDQVRECINELAKRNSKNSEEGHLTDRWTVVQTSNFTESDLTLIFFKEALPTDPPNFDRIDDRIGIYCSVNKHTQVVGLRSPEVEDGKETIKDYVANGDAAEEKAFNQIAESLRSGTDVYAFESFYKIDGPSIAIIGKTTKIKLDPRDFTIE